MNLKAYCLFLSFCCSTALANPMKRTLDSFVLQSSPLKTRKLETSSSFGSNSRSVDDDSNVDIGMKVNPAFLVASTSKMPKFTDQRVLRLPGMTKVDDDNSIIFGHKVLNCEELEAFISGSASVDRYAGKSAFNSNKPRREVGYTVDGSAFRYSGIKHPTTCYPSHVLDIIPRCMDVVDKAVGAHPYRELSISRDIIYSDEFKNGGSVGMHSDEGLPWGLVIIYSLGQTRWLRIRRKSDGEWFNIEVPHNSVVAMFGRSQTLYTHQVDKLQSTDIPRHRLSCNMRFLDGEDNMEIVRRFTRQKEL